MKKSAGPRIKKAFANNQNLLTGTGLTNAWTGVTETNKWRSEYSYDANGNIRNLKRYDQGGTLMDNLTYTYEEPSARLNTNRLLHVQDAVSGSTNPTDFEVTAAHNPSNPYYAYDQIGNLVKDSSEAIQKIEWDVYGKLKKVDRNSSSTKPDIEFLYNSAGQRIMKIVKPNGGTGAMSTWKYTIWAYDLGGNVMAEYGIDYVSASNKYTINAKSHFLYGAGRLGKDLRDSTDYVPLAFRPTGAYTEVQSCSSCATDAVAAAGAYQYGPTVIHTRQLGYKQFELSNHTGNILMVVSDRKNAVDIGTWVAGSTSYNTASFDRKLDYYVADVVEVTDYYPGGMPMPGRSIVDTKFSTYAWGHNGQFNDDEIYGKGNTQMAEFWEYDARLMRRWNTDPLAHAGQSLYEAFYSNPIAFADPLGLKPEGDFGPGKRGAHRRARATAREHKRNGETNVQVIHNKEKKRYEVTYDRRPQEDPTVESEAGQRRVDVLVIGTDPGTFPYETDNAWTNAVHKIKWGATFLAGMANSIGSNGLWGAGRADPNMFGDNYAQAAAEGQIAGDYISFAIALGEMYIGATLEGGGIALDATVIGLPGGVTLNIAGAALMTHSAGMGASALRNIVDNMNTPEDGKSHSGSDRDGKSNSASSDTEGLTRKNAIQKGKEHAAVPRESKGGEKIGINELNPSSRGSSWEKMKAKGAKSLGLRNPNGKNQWMEHPDGHPDAGQPGVPKHHNGGHIHSTNSKGETKIFPYKK